VVVDISFDGRTVISRELITAPEDGGGSSGTMMTSVDNSLVGSIDNSFDGNIVNALSCVDIASCAPSSSSSS